MQCLILDSNDLTDVASLAMADAILRSGGFSNVERYLQNGKERPHGMGGSHKAYLSLLANPRCSPGGMVAPKCAIALKQWCAGETTDEKLEELASHMALTLAHCGKALVPKWVSLLANAQPTRFITACVETALKCDRIGVQARASPRPSPRALRPRRRRSSSHVTACSTANHCRKRAHRKSTAPPRFYSARNGRRSSSRRWQLQAVHGESMGADHATRAARRRRA